MVERPPRRRGQAWRNLLLGLQIISPPPLKKLLLKCFLKTSLSRSAHIGWFSGLIGSSVRIGHYAKIRAFTIIRCAGDVSIGNYAEISSLTLIYGASSLELGDHSYIGPQCLIDTSESVRIGKSSALGPRSMVFTHGSFLPYTDGYPVKFAGVTIGDHAWLAAGVFLHPGVTVGSHVFINSMAVVTQDLPSGGIAEGTPARKLWAMEKFKRPMSSEKVDHAVSQILERFAQVVLSNEMGLQVRTIDGGGLSFTYRGRRYLIAHIHAISNGAAPSGAGDNKRTRFIFVNNNRGWAPSATIRDPLIFDVGTMRTAPSRDPIHVELFQFMKRYYGLQFEYKDKPQGR